MADNWTTIVELYTGVPIGSTDRPHFASEGARDAWFQQFFLEGVTNAYYVRDGIIKYPKYNETIRRANYLRFINKSGHAIYCSIKNTEYINQGTTAITYETDAFCSWVGHFDLKPCFVEREHVKNDVNQGGVKYNTPEFGEIGQYFVKSEVLLNPPTAQQCYIVYAEPTIITHLNDLKPQILQRVFSGVCVAVFTDVNAVIGLLTNPLLTALDLFPILSVVQAPLACASEMTASSNPGKPTLAFNTYTAKNEKMLCYPHQYIEAVSPSGEKRKYYYEDWPDSKPTFMVQYGLPVKPFMCLSPLGARGVISDYANTMWYESFPTIPFATGALASVLSSVGNVLSIAGTAYTGSSLVGGAIAGGLGKGIATGAVGSGSSASVGSTGYANVYLQDQTFKLRFMCMKEDAAQQCDNFFSRYGYQVNRLKKPELNSRPAWCYVKTQGCNITGNMPYQDKLQIEALFDAGLTLWQSGATYGDYSQDNRG